MSRLGMFACLLMLVAVAVCVEMPPNMKAPEPPKDVGQKLDASRHDPQIPPRPEGPRPDAPRSDGRPDLPKGENPKPDAKESRDGKS